jgi:CHAT domain-containing protein/Tfp pilus assembly protein PilF
MRIDLLLHHLIVPPLAALLVSNSVGQDSDVVLNSTDPIQRQIARGDEHRYRIALAAGELASIVVEQKGIDVGVLVRDESNAVVEEFQDEIRRDGEERVEIVAEKAGSYVLSIKPADGTRAQGDYLIRLDETRPASDADRRMQEARVRRTQARQLERTGKYAEARSLFEQSLAAAESVRGCDDAYVALVAFDLAGNALERLDNARSRELYARVTQILEDHWGSEHPYPAMARSRVALLDERAGERQKAEAGIRGVLPILERTLGPEHPWYLRSLGTLANLRQNAGDLEQAEQLDRNALTAVENTGQTGTLLHATLLNNLGDVVRARSRYADAQPLFEQSLAIGQSILGSESLFVATAFQNIGIIARERKDYATALASYDRALSIRQRLLGPDHPSLAGILTNVANVYRATRDYQKALDTQFEALRMWEKAVGPYGRESLLVIGNIARTYAAAGDIDNALAFQRRADAILETQLTLYVATGSERQKLAVVRNDAERTDRTISLHLLQGANRPDAASLAALVILQRKGRVQDAMTDVFASVRQRVSDPRDRAVMDELRETTAHLARIVVGNPNAASADLRESIAELELRKEQLEAALSQRSAEFRAELNPVTLEAVQSAIPADAALVEFAVFRPFDPVAERNDEAYGRPHYAAYVITKRHSPVGVDLGAVADIDPLVVHLRDALRNPADGTVRTRARALDEKIMQPLRVSLDDVTRLLISPDGGLNLVPFETLVDKRGRFLIERFATTYLTSGRDLLRMQIPRAAAGKPVIVADPLFGEPLSAELSVARLARRIDLRSVTTGTEISNLYFTPLSGSAVEARAIKTFFPDATLLTGRQATKATIERLSAPSILHIASHGFFLEDNDGGPSNAIVQNPLLRSGVALAGANLPGEAHGAGILTALEAAGLDLWGTSLVTLSACDTGVGEVRNGEGVYGLRRAFMLAGSETLVMSLWPVSDSVARDTMVAYYARLRAGFGRGDALRQAKLAILRHTSLRHPYYWGGFIQSGDWTRLRLTH